VGARRDRVLEAPAGRVGQVEDGREPGLQPPPPGSDEVLVLISDDQGPQPPMAGGAAAHEEAAARSAGRGQAVQQPHGAIRCPSQPEVAVKEQDGADCREWARAKAV
jgi:hypothetical protein